MKRITKITLFAVGLVLAGLAGIVPGFRPLAELQAVVPAANDHVLTFDVACDCRTGSQSVLDLDSESETLAIMTAS